MGLAHELLCLDLAGGVRILRRRIQGAVLVHRGTLAWQTQYGQRAHVDQALHAGVLASRHQLARAIQVDPKELAARAPVRHLGCGVEHDLLAAGCLAQRREVAHIAAHDLRAQTRQAVQVAGGPDQRAHLDPVSAKGRYQIAAEKARRPGNQRGFHVTSDGLMVTAWLFPHEEYTAGARDRFVVKDGRNLGD